LGQFSSTSKQGREKVPKGTNEGKGSPGREKKTAPAGGVKGAAVFLGRAGGVEGGRFRQWKKKEAIKGKRLCSNSRRGSLSFRGRNQIKMDLHCKKLGGRMSCRVGGEGNLFFRKRLPFIFFMGNKL